MRNNLNTFLIKTTINNSAGPRYAIIYEIDKDMDLQADLRQAE